MPSFIHEERSVLVGLDGKGTFLVVTWLCKATRTGPSPLHVGPLFSLASPATKPLHTRFQVEEKENAAKIEFQTCLLASKVVSHPSRIPHRSLRSPMECDFLDWKVLIMNMYSIKRGFDDWFSVSLFRASPATKPLHTRSQGEEKENATKFEFQRCLLASKLIALLDLCREKEGMMADKNQRYLLVLTPERICGIDTMKLITPEEEETVNWENLPPFPFDFSVDLPRICMYALELDSKIHLVGGRQYYFPYHPHNHGAFQFSKKVFELDLDKKEVEESKSIDDAPTDFDTQFTTCYKVRSDYYFIETGGFAPVEHPPHYFSVLRSGTKFWECLPDAPGHPDMWSSTWVVNNSWFDFYGKLYLRLCLTDGRVFIHYYDTDNPHKGWTKSEGDNSFTGSFCVPVGSDGQRHFFHPTVHIPDLVDPGKYLALSCERIGGKKVICAFQVDELGVLIFQRLDGCLDRMPSFYRELDSMISCNCEKTPVLVDLDGKGTFLVMLPGFAKGRIQVVCMLVLQVVAKKVVSHPSRILRRSVRSPMECDFLDWKILSMHMYSMKEDIEDWSTVSIFPGIPCDEATVYEVPRRGKRKYSQI
ncbi:uncharacterized protein [Arachis hypogaea]|uniref:uncharacterized protein isoform X1 n=1 Tax=Arachis hypogaea TaxID=3818 RepID=UPI000DEC2AE2|nr:uncharacterized protein LOC112728796 isoform X2 [Arachis hypogaea]XP_029149569.1 uncharacterized protein LOC112758210 isoform X2 [Arachis hypogaea]